MELHSGSPCDYLLLPFQDSWPQPPRTSPPVPKQDPGSIGLYLEAVSFGQCIPTMLSMVGMPWLKTKTAWDSEGLWPSAGAQASYRGCRVGVWSSFLLPPSIVSVCDPHHHISHLDVPNIFLCLSKFWRSKFMIMAIILFLIYYDWQL